MNFVDRILFQCKLNPPAIALGAPGTEFSIVSYARLERAIDNVARKAISLGLERNNVVALYVMNPVLHAIIILGLMRIGVVTVTGQSPELPKELLVDAVITDVAFPYQTKRVVLADSSWTQGANKPLAAEHIPAVDADDICRVALTTGTTGEQRAVAFTHRMLAAQVARHQYVFGSILPNCARTYCGIGFAAAISFRFLIYTLARGGAYFMAGSDLENTVEAFEVYQIQNIITSQGGLAKLVEFYEARGSLRSNLQMIKTGGSVLSKTLSDRVRARICPNLVNAMGATETSTIASASAADIAPFPGAAGYVLPDISVEIVDGSGNLLAIGKEGVVRIRGPYNARGYLNNLAASEEVFRDACFYTGDRGYLTSDNVLVITGREKALLNVGGAKLAPELVEDVLTSFSGIAQAAVFSIPDQFGNEVLCATIVARSEVDPQALRAHCDARLPSEFVPMAVMHVPDLPLNAAGKVDRRQLAEFAKAKLNSNASRAGSGSGHEHR